VRVRTRCALMAGAVVLAATVPDRIGAQAPQRRDSIFQSAGTAVVVDVMVRDSRGRPVRGLTLPDFDVREDGVRQTLQAIEGTADAPSGNPGPPSDTASGTADVAAESARVPGRSSSAGERQPQAPRPGRFIALVFDRLSADSRPLAYQAALSFVERSNPGDRIGVFVSDLSPETIQEYTADREALRQAVRSAALRATAVFDTKSQLPTTASPQGFVGNPEATVSTHPSVPDTAGAELAGRVVGQDRKGMSYDERTLEGIGRRLFDTFWERLARDQQGYATTNAIEAIAAGLAARPGRKALVLFAEGLAIPDAVLPHFERAVATASQAQVSVYSVDAMGLRVHSGQAAIKREIGAIGAAGLDVGLDGSSGNNLQLMERNEDALRKDSEGSLRLLAERTGGVLINNTNDLSRVAGVVDLDFREQYVLTYQPKNTDFRGEWRRIEVRVPGRRVTVRARAGYLAVKAGPGGEAVLAHEARAIAALDQSPAPTAVPVQLVALTFPDTAVAARLAVLVSAPLATVATRDGDRYDAEFTVLARIRDASGAVVRTASEPYRITGRLTEGAMPGARVLFVRHPQLAPGRYSVEVAIADAAGIRAGVARAMLDVPAATAAGLGVSDLVVVERAAPVAANADAANPLVSAGQMLYPSLTGSVPGGAQATVGVFFRVIAAAGAPVGARLELRRDGAPLAEVPLELPARDASGRVDYQGRVPVGALAAGLYELRLIVSTAASTVERRAVFRRLP